MHIEHVNSEVIRAEVHGLEDSLQGHRGALV